jgi:hypothetical protein
VEEVGIYRGEVFAIMGALADLKADVKTILGYIEEEDDGEEEEEDLPDA